MAQIPQNRQFQEAKVPSHWGTSERRYAQGVNDLFERLFYMFGRLSKDDLAKPLNKEITDATGNILRIESDVDQVQLTLTTVQGDVSSLTLSQSEFATQLENAQGNITTLQQTATGLQTQVNNLGNRNRTYLPGTVPSVSERVEGDLLIDTANGNILKRWNGSSWVAVQDGAISIAQQQADKIQWLVASGTSGSNMTLTSQLYSLMAANIDLSANNSIKLAVGGGTNLLKNSDFQLGAEIDWNKSGSPTANLLTYEGFDAISLSTAGDSTERFYYQNVDIEPTVSETPYTFSFFSRWSSVSAARWNGDRVVLIRCYGSDLSTITAQKTLYPTDISQAGSWQYNSVSITVPAGTYRIRVYFCLVSYETGVGTNILIAKTQLEKGPLATDWSPSPEDPASGVKTSKIEIGSDFIDIASGGTLTLDAADDIKIGSGGGTLASTIDLSANNSIKLAVTSQSANLFPSHPSDWEQGTINEANGSLLASTTRIRGVGYITLNPGALYTVSRVKSLTGNIFLVYYDNSNTVIGHSGAWVTTYPYSFSLPSGATKMRVIVRRAANDTIVPTDVPDILFSIVPAGVSGDVKTSTVTIDTNGVAIATGGTFTTSSQNFNIDAAGNVTMKGQVEATAGKIGGLNLSGGILDNNNALPYKRLILNPVDGTMQVGLLSFDTNSTGWGRLSCPASTNFTISSDNTTPGTPLRLVGGRNSEIIVGGYSYASKIVQILDDLYVQNNCSALSFTDRTPAYSGNALDELRWVQGKKGQLDHDSIPPFARKQIATRRDKPDGSYEEVMEEGRDLGAMISILTKAVQQLIEKVDTQQTQINQLMGAKK